MRTYEIIKSVIALRNRDIQEVAATIGTSRGHLSRYLNGKSPNFAQDLQDRLLVELDLKIVIAMEDVNSLVKSRR
jgi:transcriptional regulator with XRE-family HTH domain